MHFIERYSVVNPLINLFSLQQQKEMIYQAHYTSFSCNANSFDVLDNLIHQNIITKRYWDYV
jgi:hypothetical protein